MKKGLLGWWWSITPRLLRITKKVIVIRSETSNHATYLLRQCKLKIMSIFRRRNIVYMHKTLSYLRQIKLKIYKETMMKSQTKMLSSTLSTRVSKLAMQSSTSKSLSPLQKTLKSKLLKSKPIKKIPRLCKMMGWLVDLSAKKGKVMMIVIKQEIKLTGNWIHKDRNSYQVNQVQFINFRTRPLLHIIPYAGINLSSEISRVRRHRMASHLSRDEWSTINNNRQK